MRSKISFGCPFVNFDHLKNGIWVTRGHFRSYMKWTPNWHLNFVSQVELCLEFTFNVYQGCIEFVSVATQNQNAIALLILNCLTRAPRTLTTKSKSFFLPTCFCFLCCPVNALLGPSGPIGPGRTFVYVTWLTLY